MNEQDHIRHDNEIKQLLTQGYFVNSKGIKSSDMKSKKKRIVAVTDSVKSNATTATNATSQLSQMSISTQKKRKAITEEKTDQTKVI